MSLITLVFQGPKKAYVTFLWSKTTLILLVLVMSNKSSICFSASTSSIYVKTTSSIYVTKLKKSIVKKNETLRAG